MMSEWRHGSGVTAQRHPWLLDRHHERAQIIASRTAAGQAALDIARYLGISDRTVVRIRAELRRGVRT